MFIKKFKLTTGTVLIASLLLTSIITTTGLQLVKITLTGKKSSDAFSAQIELLNSVKTAQDLVSRSMDSRLSSLDQATGNVIFVNSSGNRLDIVNDPDFNNSTIKDIRELLFENLKVSPTEDTTTSQTSDNNKNSSGTEDGSITLDDFNKKNTIVDFKTSDANPESSENQIKQSSGNFIITMKNSEPLPNDNSKVKFTLEVSAAICNQQGTCEQEVRTIEKVRSCPKPTNGKMIALTGTGNLPPQAKENFPNIYCSCSNATPFTKTTAEGQCVMP